MAILLRGGYKDYSSIDVAISLLKKYDSLNSISKLYIDELCEVKEIGKDKAITLLAAFELSRRGLLSEGKKIVIK